MQERSSAAAAALWQRQHAVCSRLASLHAQRPGQWWSAEGQPPRKEPLDHSRDLPLLLQVSSRQALRPRGRTAANRHRQKAQSRGEQVCPQPLRCWLLESMAAEPLCLGHLCATLPGPLRESLEERPRVVVVLTMSRPRPRLHLHGPLLAQFLHLPAPLPGRFLRLHVQQLGMHHDWRTCLANIGHVALLHRTQQSKEPVPHRQKIW